MIVIVCLYSYKCLLSLLSKRALYHKVKKLSSTSQTLIGLAQGILTKTESYYKISTELWRNCGETVEKLLKTTYTYTITNTVLGTIVYVGKSVNPEHRWKVHKSCVKCIGKPNEKFVVQNIHYHMAEFGIDNFVFSVFADCDCEAQLQEQIRPMCCVKYENL